MAIKSCWLVIFAGGTINFITSLDKMGSCFGILNPHNCPSDYNLALLNLGVIPLLHVVYILTFFRFYVGDIRVFDFRYSEVYKFANMLADTGEPHTAEMYRQILKYSDNNVFKL